MKVQELIDKLREFPPDVDVVVDGQRTGVWYSSSTLGADFDDKENVVLVIAYGMTPIDAL